MRSGRRLEFKTPVSGREEAYKVLSKASVNWEDRQCAMQAVSENGLLLSRAPQVFKADKEVVLAAVQHCGAALQYAATALRDDHEVVEEAVRESGLALEHATTRLKSDSDLVLKAVKQNGSALEYAAPELRADRDFVLRAVEESARALSCASDSLLFDPAFIKEAVQRNSWALGYTPKHIQDRGLVLDRWHEPPKRHQAPPSQLPGLHVSEVPRPPWQADKTVKKCRPRSRQQQLEVTALPEQIEDPFPFPGFELPLELEAARKEALQKAGIEWQPRQRDANREKDLVYRANLSTRESNTLPPELEEARRMALQQVAESKTRPALPTELEMARQAALRRIPMSTV